MIGGINSSGSGSGFGSLELNSASVNDARTLSRQRSFSQVMSIEGRRNEQVSTEDEARDAAERLVAATLIEPLLKSMRASNNAAEPFAPTQAEKQLQALADTATAHDLVRKANFPIVDRMARDLLAKSEATG